MDILKQQNVYEAHLVLAYTDLFHARDNKRSLALPIICKREIQIAILLTYVKWAATWSPPERGQSDRGNASLLELSRIMVNRPHSEANRCTSA